MNSTCNYNIIIVHEETKKDHKINVSVRLTFGY